VILFLPLLLLLIINEDVCSLNFYEFRDCVFLWSSLVTLDVIHITCKALTIYPFVISVVLITDIFLIIDTFECILGFNYIVKSRIFSNIHV